MSRSTITPHPSHIMGEVDGEVCCIRKQDGVACHAAPWMPIIEQECGSHSITPLRDTEARDAAIAAAYDRGDKVRDIAVLLGVSVDTIKRVAAERCVRRHAGRLVLPPITPAMVAEAQRRLAAGDALADIAADVGADRKRLLRKLRDMQKAAACAHCRVVFVEAGSGPWVNTRQPNNTAECRGCMEEK